MKNMVLEKLHGLRSTSISLNDRFTILAKTPIGFRPQQPWRDISPPGRHPILHGFHDAWRSEAQVKGKRAMKDRLGLPRLRRAGSEGNLPRLQRSNSLCTLNQQSIMERVSWWNPNGNLSRSASFSNLSTASWRNFRRRGGGQRQWRGRLRGRSNGVGRTGRVSRVQFRPQRAGQRPQQARRVRGAARGAPRAAPRGAARGRGGVTRNQQQQKPVTKEDLDRQLDQYMAGTKAALDLELDIYMKNAMEME